MDIKTYMVFVHLMVWLFLPLVGVASILINFLYARHFRWLWLFTAFELFGLILMAQGFLTLNFKTGFYIGLFAVATEACVSFRLAVRNFALYRKLLRLKSDGADEEQILAVREKLSPFALPLGAQKTLLRAAEEPITELLQPSQNEKYR